MPRLHHLFLAAVLFAAAPMLHVSAQDAVPASLQGAIERARAALAQTPDEAAAAQLDQATADDQEADRLLAEARVLTTSMPTRSREASRIEAALREDPAEIFRRWREELPANAGAATLRPTLDTLRAAADVTATALGQTTAALAQIDARPDAIREAIEQNRLRISELEGAANDPAGRSAPAGLAAQAALRRVLADNVKLEAEQVQLPVQRRLLELRQQQQQREAELQHRKIEVLESLLAEGTDAELNALERRLAEQANAVSTADPLVVTEVERNVALGRELAQVEGQSRRASEQLRLAQQRRSETADALRNTKARLELGGGNDTVGLILLNERRRLEDPALIARNLDDTRRRLAEVQLRILDLDEQADGLVSPDAAANALLQGQDNEELEATGSTLRADLAAAFATRGELVTRLLTDQRALAQQLSELERALQAQLETARELSTILDRELLWFPSHERVSKTWVQRQVAGWADLFKPSRYVTSARLLADAFRTQWPWVILALGLFAVLVRLAHQVPARLDELAQPLLRVRTDAYRYTARALLLTALAAAAWPLLLATLGWLLQHAGQPGKFSDSLGRSLTLCAGGMFLYQLLAWLSRENGVGHKHFRWTRARREAFRAAVPWLWALLPLQFLLALAFVRAQEPAVDAVARLMQIAFCAIGAWIAWRLLAPGAAWTTRGVVDIEPARLRKLLRVLLPLAMGGIALLALNGYVLTAAVILGCLWMSGAILLGVAILHGMISRWFLLSERRLALKRIEQKREAEAAAAAEAAAHAAAEAQPAADAAPQLEIVEGTPGNPPTSAATPASDPEAELITLESVNQQTRRLLRAFTLSLLIVGLFLVWADVLPALDRLDEIALWKVSATDDAGQPTLENVTLGGLLFGLLALALTFVAARNLPGLVELGLLSRIHIDAATRYAITSVSRYVIVIGGMILGLGLLGVRWSQLQWLAAALTVGLGFGLQEIFANFVSGLIILFERPFRVGDMITIGEVEGTVTKIRTRATTLLDGDNREVVVPNKMFITSRFINWTLSDTVTRVVFKLGLAQDSDPQLVRQMLLDLARSEPLVLDTPPPVCWFLQISPGTYDFELRVHVAELLHRNRVRDELNRKIAAAMKERDIATGRAATMNIKLIQPDDTAPQPQG